MFKWTDDLRIGVKKIDDDHKIILQYMRDFINAINSDRGTFHIDSIFQKLMDYAVYHFEREEAVMEICNYENRLAHQKSHALLMKKLINLRNKYMQTPDKSIEGEIQGLLEEWLIDHILKEDVPIRAIVKINSEKLKEAGF